MGIWDSIKKGANNFADKTTLENKLINNEVLTDEEMDTFERLSKTTYAEDIKNNPSKYFKKTVTYGKLEIDEPKQLFKFEYNVYPFEDLNKFELVENGDSITSGGLSIGRAIVGGALFGGVGAVIGGVTKKRKQTNYVDSLYILVTLNNRKFRQEKLHFITKKQDKDKKYEKILLQAKDTLTGFDYILESMDEIEVEPVSSNAADDIRKYKDLLDDGIITQEEFEAKKKELLGM